MSSTRRDAQDPQYTFFVKEKSSLIAKIVKDIREHFPEKKYKDFDIFEPKKCQKQRLAF